MIVASSLSRKRPRVSLIVAARRIGGRFKCRVGGWSGWPAFAFERGTATIAFDVHLEDRGVMDEAIDDGERHCLVGEDLAPLTERLIGGDQQGSALVSGADQFEQDAGFGLILGEVGKVVEDQQVVLV